MLPIEGAEDPASSSRDGLDVRRRCCAHRPESAAHQLLDDAPAAGHRAGSSSRSAGMAAASVVRPSAAHGPAVMTPTCSIPHSAAVVHRLTKSSLDSPASSRVPSVFSIDSYGRPPPSRVGPTGTRTPDPAGPPAQAPGLVDARQIHMTPGLPSPRRPTDGAPGRRRCALNPACPEHQTVY